MIKEKNIYTYIHLVFFTFVIIFKFILIYLLHVLFVLKIKGIFGEKIQPKSVESDGFLYI